MADIRTQKLLYHITSFDNLASILANGLLPRADIKGFEDVADHEILDGRKAYKLEHYVPFHFFARNPFDGGVQRDNPQTDFVLIAVRRAVAQARSWKIIPRHPLAAQGVEVLDYDEGFNRIDWDAMNRRDYHDEESKSVCMAECISPKAVAVDDFFMIFVPSEQVKQNVQMLLSDEGVALDVKVNEGMFL
ncbi:DarT ssDNA thymidine ADP-ribosyltransferase family protein [Vibrio tapetis subsp. quintayensis]|uniref:DarT ssDNA thymidine ADP-ribosyltransferase family protein n=1 Tax=Vibrio tapetis TaxID=52443 RepID=UPI0025B55799|nr:DarT ssDNA thymidine ADP-ribosyltransferase family protein [Vibrio tapetis]MDN3680089.1 DarT ssDNA thymidine ADP-ribosyltransferase family protein [Vibrio tapetis subsp. quintayensis]